MRNVILAIGIILAGLSANLGVVSAPPGSLTQHSEAGLPTGVQVVGSRTAQYVSADHPLTIIYDLYRGQVKPPDPATPQPEAPAKLEINAEKGVIKVRTPAELESDPCKVPEVVGSQLTFVIATVVDPIHTHLALAFDRQLESIMKAAQDSGYVFYDHWLPWRIETASTSGDASAQDKHEAEAKRRAKLPGILFFRGPEKNQDLAVFLVGETPTKGIDQDQFHSAACFIKQMHAAGPLRGILGPTYSGSFLSLERALRNTNVCGEACLDQPAVLSGTTTDRSAIESFRRNGFSGFDSTLYDDSVAFDRLRRQQRWGHVAILSEGETTYGRDAGKLTSKNPDQIMYPREISRLRNAYQDDPTLARQANPDSQAVRTQLLLPLRDQNGRDTIPQFSSGQTPVTQETVLFQIAEVLKERRYEAAVVTGSNVLDTLFLSRFLRENCPDVQVVTLDSDLLFIHGTDSLDYLGTLSVSTYPLLPDLLAQAGRNEGQRFFASNAEGGTYDAALYLLRENLRDSAVGLREDLYRPGLLLSVIGRGQYWPLAVLELPKPFRESSKDRTRPAPISVAPASRIWNGVFAAASLLSFFYAGAYLFAIRGKLPPERWCADFHPRPDKSTTLPNRMPGFFVLTTLLLLAGYCALCFPVSYLAFRAHADKVWWMQVSVAMVIAGALMAVAIDTSRKFWRSGLTLIPIFVGGLALWTGIWMYETSKLPYAGLFYAVRSVQLPSGVDPSIPLVLLFLALAWWAWTNWQRRIFIAERDPRVPNLRDLESNVTDDLQALLNKKLFPQDHYAPFIALCAIAPTLAGWRWLQSLETWPYDWLFLTLLSIIGAALLTTAWGYYQIWRHLRALLEALNLHPIRNALKRLPAVSHWSPLWQSSVRARSYVIPERFMEVVKKLRHQTPCYCRNLQTDVIKLEDEIATISLDLQKQKREDPEATQLIVELENSIASNLETGLLQGCWDKGSSESVDKIEDASSKDKPEKPSPDEVPHLLAAEAIALRYVAFIRYALLHLQNQLNFLTVGFILTTVALNSYPFQGRSYVRWWTTITFVLLTTVVADVFIKMGRDATLSHLTDTPVGKVDTATYLRMLSAGALPLLAVSASHFPSVGRFLFSWLQPTLSALH